MSRTPKSDSTLSPSPAKHWHRTVSELTVSLDAYLSRWQPPITTPPDPGAVSRALAVCQAAADAVGDEVRQLALSRTLYRAHCDAVALAKRVLARPPFPSLQAWLDATPPAERIRGREHDCIALRLQSSVIAEQARDPVVGREMEEASLLSKAPKGRRPNPDRERIRARVKELRASEIKWRVVYSTINDEYGTEYTFSRGGSLHKLIQEK